MPNSWRALGGGRTYDHFQGKINTDATIYVFSKTNRFSFIIIIIMLAIWFASYYMVKLNLYSLQTKDLGSQEMGRANDPLL